MSDEIKFGDVLIIKYCRPDYYFKAGTKCSVHLIDADGDVWVDFNNQGNPPGSFQGDGIWCLGDGQTLTIFEKVNNMSEVTLHGYPVKVGDRVWDFKRLCWLEVIDDNKDGTKDQISKRLIQFYVETLFWKPIDPAAIEAAKVKPKPVEYEWRWQYTTIDEKGNYLDINDTEYYKTEKEMLMANALLGRVDFIRIERSKREAKP